MKEFLLSFLKPYTAEFKISILTVNSPTVQKVVYINQYLDNDINFLKNKTSFHH